MPTTSRLVVGRELMKLGKLSRQTLDEGSNWVISTIKEILRSNNLIHILNGFVLSLLLHTASEL